MKKIISYCGLHCHECPALIATQTNNQELREKTAAEWSQMYQADIQPENIVCSGCLATDGPMFQHCQVCEIRSCASTKNIAHCGECADYACEKLTAFFQWVPEAKNVLDHERNQ